jgi:membrane-associated phospholipid phosphatase
MEQKKDLKIGKPENIALLIFELIAVTTVSFISVWGFARISSGLKKNNLEPFKTDVKILNFLDVIQSPKLTKVMEAISFLANFKGVTVVAGALTFGFFKSKNNRVYSFEMPVISIGCEILNLLFKAKYRRNRPAGHALRVRGWSYPSGHAMESISLYGFLSYLLVYKSKLPTWAAVSGSLTLLFLIFAIGISRSYLKAHFPSDVIAGYALGFLWLVSALWIVHEAEDLYRQKTIDVEIT